MLPPNALHRDDRAALDLLLEAEGIVDLPKDAITRRPDLKQRISFAQRRLWFLHQLNPASAAYNIVTAIRLQGPLDLGVLRACFEEIERRHEVLRTTFLDQGNGPEPCLHDRLEIPISVLKLSNLAKTQRETKVRTFTAEQAALPFDLRTGPLLRVSVALLSPQEQVMALAMHHIVADAWSLAVLVNELSTLYAAFAAGLPSPLPALPIQYADYSHWQWERRNSYQKQLAFWQESLRDAPPLNLPTDRSRPVRPSFSGGAQSLWLPGALVGRLKALGEQEHATMFMTLLTAFQVLLSRYSGQTDIVVGAPIAGRNRSELEPLIGFFVNSLVLRVRWSSGATFRDVLRQTRSAALQAYANQDVPFDEVVRALQPERGASHNPLFQVMFSVETEIGDRLNLKDTSFRSEPVDTPIAKFDLTLNLAPAADGLLGGLEYSTDLFDDSTARRMTEHFVQLLESICAYPDGPVDRMALTSDEELYRIVSTFNATQKTLPIGSLGELFEEQARAHPENVAVEFDGREWSYAELNRAATFWATELLRCGIRSEDRVAVCMEPSFEMVVAVLAIIRAGATYIPLIPSYPDQRLGFILRDANVRLLLTQPDLKERLSQFGLLSICLDSARVDAGPPQNPARTGSDHLAYVMYTSGSTGEPKGIEVTHRAVVRLVRNTNYIDIGSDDRVALASNFAFDAATFELWGTLLNGARLVVIPREIALDPDRLGSLLRTREVTTLFLTASLFNQIARLQPDTFATLRHLLVGGEALDSDAVRMVLNSTPPGRLLNGYGPTECTTFALWHEVRQVDPDDRTIPIGRPISNTRAYVVDRNTELLPPGIPGELLLAGPGLARGYLNRPELTASLFIPDPFSGEPGERLYRTGDLVRWRDNGNIEFLGRIDEQVKIRGFRIEPGEIAATLARHSAVKESVVIVREDVPGKKQLVGYVVAAPGEKLSMADLRTYLTSLLPDYMIPSALVELPQLPLNANGKVERKALPPPELSREPDDTLEPPRNELEQAMVDAWRSVLGDRPLGVDDNYFHLGGDSITAIQLVSRLKQAGWELSVRDLFEHPTVRSLVPSVQRRKPREQPSQKAVIGPVSLTPIQRWFFDEYAGDLHYFNQDVLLRSKERLDPVALRQVLQRLWEHHDALRMTYSFRGSDVLQTANGTDSSPGFEVVDLRNEENESASLRAHATRVQSSFDLERGPLFKAVLFRLSESDRLLLVSHHLAVDGVSWRILLEDLQCGYAQSRSSQAITFAPKTDSFQRWAQEIERFSSSESVLADQTYWSDVLKQAGSAFPRDTDVVGPNLYGDSETIHTALSLEETSRLLTESHQAYDTEVNDLLLTALGRALPPQPGNRQALIALEGHGREQLDVELDLGRTVGWFTCWHPFLLPSGEGGLGEQIKQVRQALRGVPKRGLSFGILRYLTPPYLEPGLRATCRPQLSFNYLGQFGARDDSPLDFAPESSGSAISPRLTRVHDLDIVGMVTAGRLSLAITFSPQHHHRKSVHRLLDAFRSQLLLLADHCVHIRPQKSASQQFTFSQLPADDINHILQSFSYES